MYSVRIYQGSLRSYGSLPADKRETQMAPPYLFHSSGHRRTNDRSKRGTRRPHRVAKNGSIPSKDGRNRDLLNNVRDGIYRITPDGHDAQANDAFARMLGLESPEEAKEALTNIIPKDCYDPECRRDVYGTHDEAGTEDFEMEIRRKDGGLSSILNRIRIIRDEKGRFIRCEGVARDVTEQRSLKRPSVKRNGKNDACRYPGTLEAYA
jgi:PAS domain S-box-containing protein